jgi:hypothetical protein
MVLCVYLWSCVSMCVGLDDALDTGRPGHVFNECVCVQSGSNGGSSS